MTTTTSRGRKPSAAAEPVDVQINTTQLAADSAAATSLVLHEMTADQQFGDGAPYDRSAAVSQVRFFLGASAEAMLEAGKRLMLIKAHESHGDFERIVSEELGLATRTARRMMMASAKYLSPALSAKRPALAVLGKAKLFDLMEESDEDIAALSEGGTLVGKTFEEIETMTTRELRAALRDHKQRLSAKDEILAEKNEQLDELREKVRRPFRASAKSAAQSKADRDFIESLTAAIVRANAGLAEVAEIMSDSQAHDLSRSVRLAAEHDLVWLGQRLAEVMRAHGIVFDLAAEVVPSWVRANKDRIDGLRKAFEADADEAAGK